jgi:YVTN family beta-propeller protein
MTRPSLARFSLRPLAISIALGFMATTAAAQGFPQGQVYTANQDEGSLTVINLVNRDVDTHRLDIAPHNVQVAGGESVIMTVGQVMKTQPAHKDGAGHSHAHHHGDQDGGELHLFAASDPSQLIARIEVGSHPAHVVSDAAGERAYVTNAGDDTISVVDLITLQVIATIETDRYPHGLRMSPDGSELYVANVMGNSVSVIDTETLEEVSRISVGNAPIQVAFTPNGSEVYVTLRDANAVAVIDTEARRVVDVIGVASLPAQVHGTVDGRYMLVANEGSEQTPDVLVSVIDTDRHQVVSTYEVGNGPHGIAVDDTGRYAFVTSVYADTLSVIDLEEERVLETYPTGKGPNGVTWRAMP